MDAIEWLKDIPSSDLLLNELEKRGLPDSAKRVFKECRLVKPLYFVDGVIFNEPQLLAANQFGPERHFILGRFADYSTLLLDCQTGKLGQGKAWVDYGEDYDFQNIPKNAGVYYEGGGMLKIRDDKFIYLGKTNSLHAAGNWVVEPTVTIPNSFIW